MFGKGLVEAGFTLRPPSSSDGLNVHQLIARCQPLDRNSVYCNLLQCTDFADTSILALDEKGQLAGFISAYLPPSRTETLFVWQVAVDAPVRGRGLGLFMLQSLCIRMLPRGVTHLETTISPGNAASRSLFLKLFSQLGADFSMRVLFSRNEHFNGHHDDEVLYRAGPFSESALKKIQEEK
ncbi:MAG: diaminobutyrate acetyltransferase [Leptospirales bacterium]